MITKNEAKRICEVYGHDYNECFFFKNAHKAANHYMGDSAVKAFERFVKDFSDYLYKIDAQYDAMEDVHN